jgi:hypothetical protein
MSQFDIVTFAGSLFYAKAARLRRELARVCPPGSTIVVYDFEILLNDVMAELGTASPAVASDYDHCVNLSDWAECAVVDGGAERLRLKVTGAKCPSAAGGLVSLRRIGATLPAWRPLCVTGGLPGAFPGEPALGGGHLFH